MTICAVCGEERFDLVDGLYYCRICQTQSQDMRQEETEEFTQARGYQLALKPKSTATSKETDPVEQGRPWTTHEAFQLIIKEQVKTLISLGAADELQEVVFKIWSLYLSRIGIAFTADRIKADKLNTIGPYQRDRFPGTVEKPMAKRVRSSYAFQLHRKSHLSKKQIKKKKEIDEYKSAFEGLDLSGSDEETIDDNPEAGEIKLKGFDEEAVEEAKKDLSNLRKRPAVVVTENEDTGELIEHNSLIKAHHKWHIERIERMNLTRTSAFCMIGLLYTNNLTSCADLSRWIKGGKLPYKNAFEQLPQDMKFGPNDKLTFAIKGTALPSASKIGEETSNIIQYLNLNGFPPVDICKLCSRYITEFNLPGDMHGLVRKLAIQRGEINTQLNPATCSLHHCSVTAASYIVFTLKLLFGLDDKTEHELSLYARGLTKELSPVKPLFLWDEWVSFMEQNTSILHQRKFGLDIEDIRNITDVGATMDMYSSRIYRDDDRFDAGRARRNVIKCQSEYREKLKLPLEILLDKMKARKQTTTQPDTSNAFSGLFLPTFNDPMADSDDSDANNSPNFSDEATSPDFQGSSLRFLTDENYFDNFHDEGLSDFTIHSSLENDEEGDVEDLDPFSQDMFFTPPHKRKSKSRVKKAVQHALQSSQIPSSFNPDKWKQKLKRAYENYAVYSNSNGFYHHRTYDWLLRVIGSSIDCGVEEIHKAACEIEVAYLDKEAGLKKSERNIKGKTPSKHKTGEKRKRELSESEGSC